MRDDRKLGAKQCIQQRRLAGVRNADDGAVPGAKWSYFTHYAGSFNNSCTLRSALSSASCGVAFLYSALETSSSRIASISNHFGWTGVIRALANCSIKIFPWLR